MAKPKALDAYVNHGRWLVDCPCGNGILVEPRADTAACLPVEHGACGKTSPVRWPAPQTVAAAAKLLEERPMLNRNWHPDRETVAVLRAENKANL